jgi:hypothetical protein
MHDLELNEWCDCATTVKFMRKHYSPPGPRREGEGEGRNKSQSLPRVAIYQSASAMHGKRNGGFHWMSEVVRRQNAQLRGLLVDELGEDTHLHRFTSCTTSTIDGA